jgi:hypothetical protein
MNSTAYDAFNYMTSHKIDFNGSDLKLATTQRWTVQYCCAKSPNVAALRLCDVTAITYTHYRHTNLASSHKRQRSKKHSKDEDWLNLPGL